MYCYTKRDRNKNPGIFPFLFTVFFGLTKDSKKRSYEFYRMAQKTADAVFILILGEFLYFYTS